MIIATNLRPKVNLPVILTVDSFHEFSQLLFIRYIFSKVDNVASYIVLLQSLSQLDQVG